jgi:hypothetical protein
LVLLRSIWFNRFAYRDKRVDTFSLLQAADALTFVLDLAAYAASHESSANLFSYNVITNLVPASAPLAVELHRRSLPGGVNDGGNNQRFIKFCRGF